MLLKVAHLLTKKQTEEDYKNYLKYIGIITIILGIVGIPVALSAKLSSFGSGMLTGMTITFFAFGIYTLIVIGQPKRLHKMYVEAHDERNNKILMVTALATLILIFLLIFALIALFAFADIVLAYPVLLMILLYGIIVGFVIFRLLFSKIL